MPRPFRAQGHNVLMLNNCIYHVVDTMSSPTKALDRVNECNRITHRQEAIRFYHGKSSRSTTSTDTDTKTPEDAKVEVSVPVTEKKVTKKKVTKTAYAKP